MREISEKSLQQLKRFVRVSIAKESTGNTDAGKGDMEATTSEIVAAKGIQQALCMTNHHDRLAFIQEVFGSRSIGGKFVATRANVTTKFQEAWLTSRSKGTK